MFVRTHENQFLLHSGTWVEKPTGMADKEEAIERRRAGHFFSCWIKEGDGREVDGGPTKHVGKDNVEGDVEGGERGCRRPARIKPLGRDFLLWER